MDEEVNKLITKLRDWARDEYEYENRATGMSDLLDTAADTIEELQRYIDLLEMQG